MAHAALLPSPLEAAAPQSLRSGRPSALRELDDLARAPEARGVVYLQGPAPVLEALGRHTERRARTVGRPLVVVGGLPTDDAWRELAWCLGAGAGSDPIAVARTVAERAADAVVVVREGAPTRWGRALADELARLAGEEGPARCLLVALTDAAPPGSRVIEADGAAAEADVALWWEAVAGDASRTPKLGLDRLEAWWRAARATPIEQRAPAIALSPAALTLLGRIALSQRSWALADVERLGSAPAAEELLRTGALAADAQGRLVAGEATLPALPAAGPGEARIVAEALDTFGDAWAAARASELFAIAADFDLAEAAAARALGSISDAAARADFWERWEQTLARVPAGEATARLLGSADLALRTGDLDRALTFAGAVAARQADSFAALLTLGRANVARGDLPTASCWLGKALERAGSPAERAAVEVELAELRHLEGGVDAARTFAEAAVAGAGDTATRLHARNVLGKLHLSASAWQKAEDHFAADACEAALAGDLMAELRARLNRSIALLSSGRLDEARAMLEAVLREGELRGELRAVAYALTNLATIAILRRDYPEALDFSERAFEVRRRLGDKVSMALLITNLAELRLMLGQVSEAEQALVFGRQACGPGMPGARASHFAFTAALVHLERRRTIEAAAQLKIALGTARASSNGARLGECHRLAARIALEDGDLGAAGTAIEQAAALAETPRERAWVALLSAAHARAAGEPFADAAADALEAARAADDPELCREAHLLAHHAAVLDDNSRGARLHLDAALRLRDQIADALPEPMRQRFLGRRDLVELAKVEAGHARRLASEPPPAPATIAPVRLDLRSGEAPLPALRRMIGRTPAMVTLAAAIQKVGASDTTVLVHGESGTGKELVAEALHEASARRHGPIVKVNCAALVETLLLSELFGHEKGSFTGAAARRRGRFEMAEGGTIFLDEIGDISPRTQVALLRVLQDRTYERVGGVTPLRANVRIVCATHRDLAAMVARGEFREDLYYRLRGVVLEVPALRARLADLGAIAGGILARVGAERGTPQKRLSPAALEGLARHPWPGNVRELENALRAAALFSDGEALELEDFTSNVEGLRDLAAPMSLEPATLASGSLTQVSVVGTRPATDPSAVDQPSMHAPSSSPTEVAYLSIRSGISLSDLKRDIERECIAKALAETGGNITRAAGLLGMKRPRLSQLVKQYGFGADAEAEDGE